MLKRTPLLALVLAGAIAVLVVILFEEPERPFTIFQAILLYCISLLPSIGIALLFDPAPAQAKEEFLKINFYEEK
jgi:hypothetical protein